MTYPPKDYYKSAEYKRSTRKYVVGVVLTLVVGCLLLLTLFLASCGGPNQAYLDRDWARFQEECAEYCVPEEAHPRRDTTPWVCGCPDDISPDDTSASRLSWQEVYFVHQSQFM